MYTFAHVHTHAPDAVFSAISAVFSLQDGFPEIRSAAWKEQGIKTNAMLLTHCSQVNRSKFSLGFDFIHFLILLPPPPSMSLCVQSLFNVLR